MLETLNILPIIKDFRARMPEKGDCQATDGESIPGPWHCKNIHAECLEFPASFHSHSTAALLAQANVLEANYIKDNYSLSDIYIGIVKCKAELLRKKRIEEAKGLDEK